MRIAVLLLVALAGAAATEWSGTFEIAETVTGIRAGGDRREDDELARSLEARLARLREALRTARPPAARTYRQDIAQLEAELQALALERGGTVTLGRTSYAVRGQRIAADGDEARLVIDRAAGRAVVIAPDRREAVELAPVPEARIPPGAAPGPVVAGVPTQRAALAVGGDATIVTWAPGLPNVYAFTRIAAQAKDPLQAALAALPGLPVEVERRTERGVQRWTVQRLMAGEVEERLLAE